MKHTGPARTRSLELDLGGALHQGKSREYMQDRACIVRNGEDHCALVVADGMGGMPGDGAKAASIALGRLQKSLATKWDSTYDWLTRSFDYASHAVFSQQKGRGGTTVTVLVLEDELAHVRLCGDSPALLVRDGVVLLREQDYAIYGHALTRFVGQADQVDTRGARWRPQVGDTLIVCSDGLAGPVNETELGQVVRRVERAGGSAQDLAEALVDEANRKGGPDNIAVLVAQIRGRR